MGDAADDLAHQEWQENSRYHGELNPRGYKLAEDFVWTTQTGEKIPLNKMGDRHLLNCLKVIERQQAQDPGSFGGGDPDDSDGAYFAKEAEEAHNDRLRESLFETHQVLTTEAKHRGLI